MGFLNTFKWFKKKITWNYKYAIGKWDYMATENLRYQAIASLIDKHCEKKCAILDLGCGFGALNKYLKDIEYKEFLGIDLSVNAIHKAQKQGYKNATFITKDIHKFIPSIKYDIIIFNEVLYYLDNQIEMVKFFANHTKTPGYMIFSFYGYREDLIHEIENLFELVHTEYIKQSDNKFWSVSLYKIN